MALAFPSVFNFERRLAEMAPKFPLNDEFWFGPRLPNEVPEANWAQTVPGKGWNMLFRLYGPLEPWFDKTWRVGEVELVK